MSVTKEQLDTLMNNQVVNKKALHKLNEEHDLLSENHAKLNAWAVKFGRDSNERFRKIDSRFENLDNKYKKRCDELDAADIAFNKALHQIGNIDLPAKFLRLDDENSRLRKEQAELRNKYSNLEKKYEQLHSSLLELQKERSHHRNHSPSTAKRKLTTSDRLQSSPNDSRSKQNPITEAVNEWLRSNQGRSESFVDLSKTPFSKHRCVRLRPKDNYALLDVSSNDAVFMEVEHGGTLFCVKSSQTGNIFAYPSVSSLTRNDLHSTGLHHVFNFNTTPEQAKIHFLMVLEPAHVSMAEQGRYVIKTLGRVQI